MSTVLCKIHNSPIGGVCNDVNCNKGPQLLCMQCVTSQNSCIRAKNHKFIPINEFTDEYFKQHLNELRTAPNYSTRVNTVEAFCKNTQSIIEKFRMENEKVGSWIIDTFQQFIDHIQKLFVAFNQAHIKFIQEKDDQLIDAMQKLNETIKYDELYGFDENELINAMSKMTYDQLNYTVLNMKESIINMRSELTVKDMETVKEITSITGEKAIKYFDKEFSALNKEAETRFNLYSSKIKEELYGSEAESKLKFSEYKCIYDDTIDFFANSNFQTKKFTMFEHSNGNTLLAYPTSQNTVKIEYVDKFIGEKTPTINPNTNPYVTQKVNARDKYTYFTLQSHSGKITDIIYYRNNQNKDFLITTSEDCTIKIWEITNLERYLKNVNEFYHSNCIKTLMGHQGVIIACLTFYDPLKNINYIVSLGYMDRVKVWDMMTGQFIRDITDSNVNRGSHDNLLALANINKKNILFTGNSTRRLIKFWDFETGQVIRVINYEGTSKIVSLLCYEEINRLYVIDEAGPCSFMDLSTSVDKITLIYAGFKSQQGDIRVGAFKWDSNSLGVYCKNGFVNQYSLNDGALIDRTQLAKTFISCAMGYIHHTKRKILVIHSGDMHLKIFN